MSKKMYGGKLHENKVQAMAFALCAPMLIDRAKLDPQVFQLASIKALEDGRSVICAGVGEVCRDPIAGDMFVFTPSDNRKAKPRYFHSAARALTEMYLHFVNYDYSKIATC